MPHGYRMQNLDSVRPSTRAEHSTKTSARAEQSAGIKASSFARADCSAQIQILQRLVACGRLIVETDSSDDEYDEIAEAAESDYDGEVEFIDDDEIRDDDSFDAHASPNGTDEERLFSLPCVYEIKIVQKGPEKWSCVPPRNPLLGYRPNGYDSEVQLILDAARRQFAFYEAVAKWLQTEGNTVLESPSAFKQNHEPMTQIAFLGMDFCKKLRSKKNCEEKKEDTGNIHGYCQKCRLVWETASLPLGDVFGIR